MRLLNAMLDKFVQTGTIRIIDADNKRYEHKGAPGPEVTLRLTDKKLSRRLFLNPELRAGEAYVDGTLIFEEGTIRDLLMIFALNRSSLRNQPLQKSIRKVLKRVRSFHQRNSIVNARANVAHHYDLSNDLYRLFLDEDMHYSCAYFNSGEDTLEVAQQNKIRHIAAKLDLKPGQKVLDIGSGWGGMAMFMAEHCDVEVLGVTLSKEQQSLATQRAKERGLQDRVRFDLTDYRDVEGQFDRIVSIGMFEHVGIDHHQEYFAKINSLLTPDGVALVHAIGRKGGPGTTGAWIRKYIFPGGYSPALSETCMAIEKAGLWVTDMEILRLHYADTLVAWEQRFQQNRQKITDLLDERFCRMWEFYLIISELSFRYGKHMVFQIQLSKSVDALPVTRTYMSEAESRMLLNQK